MQTMYLESKNEWLCRRDCSCWS